MGYKIVEREQWSEKVFMMKVIAPDIAKHRKAGNFIIFRLNEIGERIPLTIADADIEAGTITIVTQNIGYSTAKLMELQVGDEIMDVIGPLGQPTHIEKHDGIVLCVGGGVGIAPLHPIAQAHHNNGNRVISILGARDKSLIIMEDMMKKISEETLICTDNGSYGEKGLVTDMIKRVYDKGDKISEVIAIGPAIMMKFVAKLTKEYNLPTTVSLNPIMIDGTGMCGCCRVLVGTETKFACVEGPEFDGHLVDFDLLMKRQAMYKREEHECNLKLS
ncbi:sulfide/dihydroorotate dehydrogenase-like FAD/NAD-binding protein [Brachyspira aalborgi]|jgi:ferredoxin--NADP+ reductase|uniref:Sulfide/dihydroorotate dehydrogenase-like FAD/NAD-binding protein n=1 Tax=Brachyspira aalborgi TaxID=29522 RepID=A0A5C8CPQ6_9SPIR|nr:sulfide/dihydroorotate dehydrogenase-like FAD/NAD-binding protein [Brachyspira aalborgi]MBS4764291.1 sulfide/dihydroorotate dehydrogenase-like FAD/NAD-binding protein [Brachyspira sp.]CCY76066.1 ferredoxin [Brachyspira sp. CAG:700]TXJ14828.1 sulfide/dihydroorotate dehydrogenase-like FAD/NAD-binding protein [Brachyspira aalborgi]TXJ18537.1 sulfide/dihydroorotate dehydrogenase-like FAD/NAD-binding protein [Brachyspira aalborgi]TXJ32846.1 sulfide/dihydroorotate dehydrogenase-like FAD/NAD-bindi